MKIVPCSTLLSVVVLVVLALPARAQVRPYIGYAYPAGGRQGATFQVRIGGQNMDGVNSAIVSGTGVTAKIIEYHRRLNNQEQGLITEQLRELKQSKDQPSATPPPSTMTMETMSMMEQASATVAGSSKDTLSARLERRINDYVQLPACQSIAAVLLIEVTVAPGAPPGEREIRITTHRGVSNPLVFYIGQLPEYARKPMRPAMLQVLGKEASALRKRPPEEIEDRINLPCTVNGQIASGEINRYRFSARKGQRLVLTTCARQLIPYIADAVPGWFQPVLVLYDKNGREVAYDDDYRFKPDPTLFYEVPANGDYVFAIYDAIYRGREDFVYRVTVGELPFVTGIFPLGARAGKPADIKMTGWNISGARITAPDRSAGPGVYPLVTKRNGLTSNLVPFALDTLPECFEREPNNVPASAQNVTLPVMINGRINRPDDRDVYRFQGTAGDIVVAEVYARRLDSPLDSVITLTDSKGVLLALNDDCEDLASGLNTHHADSYFRANLPRDGAYFVSIGDTTRRGGDEYAYRLRLSAPRPEFALRVAPSSVSVRGKGVISPTLYVLRKDGFTGPITLTLKNPPSGFSAAPVVVTRTQMTTQVTMAIKTDRGTTTDPITLVIEGRSKLGQEEFVCEAAPAEDRMQAFLWRHLVPAKEFKVLIFDPNDQPPPEHPAPYRPTPVVTNAVVSATSTNGSVFKPGFTKQQVANRIREIKRLYEDGLLTDAFYDKKMTECEAAQ